MPTVTDHKHDNQVRTVLLTSTASFDESKVKGKLPATAVVGGRPMTMPTHPFGGATADKVDGELAVGG